jgi:hypothetical protein
MRGLGLTVAILCACGSAPPAKKIAVPVAPISESDARTLVTKWLAAQNQGDFAAY